jgi:hypothetical protein
MRVDQLLSAGDDAARLNGECPLLDTAIGLEFTTMEGSPMRWLLHQQGLVVDAAYRCHVHVMLCQGFQMESQQLNQ